MNLYTTLAFQNIVRHPIRSLITTMGIALGVAVILAVSMLNDTTRHLMERTVEDLGSGTTDIWVEEFGENTSSIGSRVEGFSEDILPAINAHPAVVSSHPSLKLYVMGASAQHPEPLEFYLCGVRFFDDGAVRNHVLSDGTYPSNPDHILIGEELANALSASVGSTVVFHTPKGPLTLIIAGLLSSNAGSGLWRNNRVVFVDLAVVQDFFRYDGVITSLNIVLRSKAHVEEVAAEIASILPEQVKVLTDPLMVATKDDNTGQLRIMLLLYSFVSIVIAMFIIYNTLSSTVEESRKEIGMLRLVGMTTQQMILLFLHQALMYAVLGSCLGLGLGVMMGWGMIALLKQIFVYQAFILVFPSLSSFLIAFGIGMAVTLIVALLPACKTAYVSPLIVCHGRETSSETSHWPFGPTAFGALILVVALVLGLLPVSGKMSAILHLTLPLLLFIGLFLILGAVLPSFLAIFSWGFGKVFGVSGLLAAKSLRLRIKRTIVTIGAIVVTATIAIGMLGSVNDMKRTTTGWLEATRWADVLIYSASGAAMDESIIQQVEELACVKEVNPLRYFFVPHDHPKLSDKGFLFQAMYPRHFQEFTGVEVREGNTLDAIHMLENQPAILLNAGLSNMLDVRHGDTLRLNTQKGAVDFFVAGSVVDYTDFVHRLGKIVYGSYDTLTEYWGATGYTVLQIRLVQGYSEAEVKNLLWRELSGGYDIKIITHTEEKEEVGALIDKLFASNYAMTVVMFLIVFMGIFNTVFINVLFQLKEIAILRTLGLLVHQIRLMIFCEAFAMGLIGSLIAGIAGIWFGWQMMLGTQELIGMILHYHLPWSIIGLTILIIPPLAIGAALYPQHIASELSIAEIFRNADQL